MKRTAPSLHALPSIDAVFFKHAASRALVSGAVALLFSVFAPWSAQSADRRTTVPTPQNAEQQACINVLNRAGAKLAKVQTKETATCLKNFSLGLEDAPEACLTRDDKGKIAAAKSKTAAAVTKFCTTAPDFGTSDSATINAAAIDEKVQLTHDVLGATFVSEAPSCQLAVVRSYEKITRAELKVFARCKKVGLRGGTVVSSTTLEGCFDAIDLDTSGRIAKAIAKLDAAIEGTSCSGLDLSAVFPGSCASASDLTDCLNERVECRVCQMLNAIDGLSKDCDLFDDGVTNTSCLPAEPRATASWADIYTTIIDPTCSGCHHGGAGGLAGLVDCDLGYSNLVGVASTQLPSMNRVEPGNPALSWLMHKLDGTQGDFTAMCQANNCGDEMPQGGALTLEERDTVRLWITGGAVNDCP